MSVRPKRTDSISSARRSTLDGADAGAEHALPVVALGVPEPAGRQFRRELQRPAFGGVAVDAPVAQRWKLPPPSSPAGVHLKKMKPMTLPSAIAVAAAAWSAQAAGPADVFAGSRQLLVVATPAADAVDGKLQRYQRGGAGEPWQPVGDPIPVVVGRNGLAWGSGLIPAPASTPAKREGDGRAPEGVFALGTSFGYAGSAPQGSKLPYLPLASPIECVDDTASRHYNRIVDRGALTPDWSSSERMRDMGESYRWGIVVDHNHIAAAAGEPKPMPGGGSCIFLHVWEGAGRGTAGCTAMAQDGIESLLTWVDPARQPLLVQLTADNYARFQGNWRLP